MEKLRSYSALFLIVSFGLFPLVAVAILEVAQQFVWQPWTIRQIQFGNQGIIQVTSITAFQGGLFVAGYEVPSCTFYTDSYGRPLCPGSVDYFLRIYNQSGRELWTRTFGHQVGLWNIFNQTGWPGELGPGLPTISVGNDSVFTNSIVNGTNQISKYDFDGNYKWTIFFPNPYPYTSISAGQNGDLFVANTVQQNSSEQLFVSRYDPHGKQAWSHSLGNSSGDAAWIYAGASTVYVVGSTTPGSPLSREPIGLSDSFLTTYSLDGTQTGIDEFGYPHLVTQAHAIAADGNAVYVTGIVYAVASSQIPDPGAQVFIRKLSPSGNLVKMALFHLPQFESFQSFMSADSSGQYMMAYYGGSSYVIKFNPHGSQAWSIFLPETRVHFALSCFRPNCSPIAAGSDGVYVGGSIVGSPVQSPHLPSTANAWDGFILEFSSSSSLILFGVNPPISFGLATLFFTPGIAWLSYRRLKAKKRANPQNSSNQSTLKTRPEHRQLLEKPVRSRA